MIVILCRDDKHLFVEGGTFLFEITAMFYMCLVCSLQHLNNEVSFLNYCYISGNCGKILRSGTECFSHLPWTFFCFPRLASEDQLIHPIGVTRETRTCAALVLQRHEPFLVRSAR